MNNTLTNGQRATLEQALAALEMAQQYISGDVVAGDILKALRSATSGINKMLEESSSHPNQTTDLPPLPEPAGWYCYDNDFPHEGTHYHTEEQIREYARLAIQTARMEHNKPGCSECAEWRRVREEDRDWRESVARGRELIREGISVSNNGAVSVDPVVALTQQRVREQLAAVAQLRKKQTK
jgi:hypothetical protein